VRRLGGSARGRVSAASPAASTRAGAEGHATIRGSPTTSSGVRIPHSDLGGDELINELSKAPEDPAARFAAETAVSLLQPYTPHVAEELWASWGTIACGDTVAGR